MSRLLLVRHGRAAAAWGQAADPGLDDLGRRQAEAAAEAIADRWAPVTVWTSPRARARETAAPLARRWGTAAEVTPAFDEIPSPPALADDPRARTGWLRSALEGRWSDLGPEVARWREGLVAACRVLGSRDVVVFTHFVAINSLVAGAAGRDDVTVFLPANGSVTELAVDPEAGAISVVTLGSEAPTHVN